VILLDPEEEAQSAKESPELNERDLALSEEGTGALVYDTIDTPHDPSRDRTGRDEEADGGGKGRDLRANINPGPVWESLSEAFPDPELRLESSSLWRGQWGPGRRLLPKGGATKREDARGRAESFLTAREA
jgi:hypothetical protein